MAKGAYIGVDGKARKIKKGYIGIDGKARKIKKAYIGIGGVARPCWSGGELTRYGTITAPTVVATHSSGASVGQYALFAGGERNSSSNPQSGVDVYNKDYTHSTTSLSRARSRLAGASVGGYALFAGGLAGSGCVNVVDAFDENLTRTTATALTYYPEAAAGISFGKYALFNGGNVVLSNYGSQGSSNITTAYDENLTQTLPTAGSVIRFWHAGARTPNHAIFGGGTGYNRSTATYVVQNSVDAYDTDLARTSSSFTNARYQMPAASVGNYVLFAGGANRSGAYFSDVSAFNDSLTLTEATKLHAAKFESGGGSLEGYAIFGGGSTGSANVANVESYDAKLTKTSRGSFSVAAASWESATVGESLFFCNPGVAVTEVYALM